VERRLLTLRRIPLLWRVFAINGSILVAIFIVLSFTPVTIHAPPRLVEDIGLAVGLLAMLAANLLLLRPTFAPLRRLVQAMRRVDLLRPGARISATGGGEVSDLVRAFNEMLERLETERREASRRAVAAQEGERARIARGLHDEVGQVLTGVLLQLDFLADDDPDQRRRDVTDTKESVRRALDEVRRISRELRPEMLEDLGLVSALTELSTKFAAVSRIAVERDFAPRLPELSSEAELAIYRVAQESLTNVARHAHASRVRLSLEADPRSVVLRVVDDGRGLGHDEAIEGNGGLRGMHERALLVGGALAVKPARGGGVEVRLEVPAEGA